MKRMVGLGVALGLALLMTTSVVPRAGAALHQTQIVSPIPGTNTPNVRNGTVYAVAQVGPDIVVGGSFTQVANRGGAIFNLSNLFAFNAQTGLIDTKFEPNPDGTVYTLARAPSGTAVFAGGKFSNIGGKPLKRLAKLDLATGAPTAGFTATIQATWIESLVVVGTRLYIGGSETKIDGAVRGRFGAVDTATGAVDPNVTVSFTAKRAGTLRVAHMGVSPDGTKMVVVGTFTLANGEDRSQIAMLDLTTNPVSVANWETDGFKPACSATFDTDLRGVDFSPDGTYFVVADTGGPFPGTYCDSAQRWESNATGTGLVPTWIDYTGGDSLTSVTVTGGAVYVGGHQRWMNNPYGSDAASGGAVQRFGIAALDPVNGLPYAWNPGRDPRGTGAWALLPTSTGLYIGSNTGYIDGLYRNRIAFMPLAGGETPPNFTAQGLPGTLYAIGASTLTGQSFNGTSLGSASVVSAPGVDWSQARGGFLLGGELYTPWSDGNMYERSFNGTTLGAATALQLNSLSPTHFDAANVTGMFYSAGRIFYTESGSHYLYWRWFEPEDGLVGAQEFIASGNGDGLDWISTTGATLAAGRIYFATSGGALQSVAFQNGVPVPGTQTTIAASGFAGTHGLFLGS
jgi:hypothetical protein